MDEEKQEFTTIKPGEPGYDELAPTVDALGGKPVPLTAGLRFIESELHKFKKMKKQGLKTTIPELADGSGNELEARPIDEKIAELEKMLLETKEVIDWAEAKRPGSSRTENGALLCMEYEKETGKKV